MLQIVDTNPLYGPFVYAQGIAADLLKGTIKDVTSGACGYFNSKTVMAPSWAVGRTPCHTNGPILFYDRSAMLG